MNHDITPIELSEEEFPKELKQTGGGSLLKSRFDPEFEVKKLSSSFNTKVTTMLQLDFLEKIGIRTFHPVHGEKGKIYYDLTAIQLSEQEILSRDIQDLYTTTVEEMPKSDLPPLESDLTIFHIQSIYRYILKKKKAIGVTGNTIFGLQNLMIYLETTAGREDIAELGFMYPLGENKVKNLDILSHVSMTELQYSNNKIIRTLHEILKEPKTAKDVKNMKRHEAIEFKLREILSK